MRAVGFLLCVPRHSAVRRAMVLACAILLHCPPAAAGGRLGWTGGVTAVEGAAGGGLATWALIGGLGTADEWGATVARTRVATQDFELDATALTVGIANRVEVSAARQRFDAGSVLPGLELGQDVIGLKVRLAGDAVFDGDRPWPQLSIGAQHKRTRDFDGVPAALGARDGEATEWFVAATKLWFAALADRNVIANVTLRRTDANQFGLLGFGGPRRSSAAWRPEVSAAVWPLETLLVGAEWRAKAPGLGAFDESRAIDVFVAWAPVRPLTLVGGWVDLGGIAGKPAQRGVYLSLWAGF
jgi:hypothetical protein